MDRPAAPRLLLEDPHRHVVDVSNSYAVEPDQLQVTFKELRQPVGSAEGESADSGRYLAIAICDPACKLTVEDRASGKAYALESPLYLETRPFSRLTWISPAILVADQWVQPHHGIHYAIDIPSRKLLMASPFPDAPSGRPR